MSNAELQAKLKQIEEAMKNAKTPEQQATALTMIADPQDALRCDGCE